MAIHRDVLLDEKSVLPAGEIVTLRENIRIFHRRGGCGGIVASDAFG
jgi:hypothetical protein